MNHPDNRNTPVIIMADDDDDDCMLAREAIEESRSRITFFCVDDGIKLIEHLTIEIDPPSLILLDLNMPGKDGRQVLKEIKSTNAFKHIPVVILTTSQAEKDIAFSKEMGADFFFTKPAQFDEWVNIMKQLIQHFLQA
ncbi:MAG: response regulator [Desulfosalsimonadaceae bacterium]|nr:response regulator [Desulfosalsimonadaceae bacterium]